MNLASAFALLAVKGSAPPSQGPGPSGPPTNLSVVDYGTPTKARIAWTNADSQAYTRIYRRLTSCAGSESLLTTANPGITSFDSTVTATSGFVVSHYRNGQESAQTACVLWTPDEEL